jgi:hypothetical protein
MGEFLVPSFAHLIGDSFLPYSHYMLALSYAPMKFVGLFLTADQGKLKKNSKVDCINLKSGLFKDEKWTLVHSSKKGGIKWTRFTDG